MKLFWKIFIAVFISFTVLISSVSYVMAKRHTSDMEYHLLEGNSFIASFISQEIERGYLESRWPFDSLSKLSKRDGFLFWWVIRDDGTIHMADEASFMGTNVYDYFPQVASITGDRNTFLDKSQNYGIFMAPLKMGSARWSFWYGFSLTDILRMRQEIISLYVLIGTSSLLLLGIILYFTVRRFTRPTVELAAGAKAIGKGDLNYRVKIETKDELGQLASSFNKMAEDLQTTTVSKTYVDNIIESMLDALVVVESDGTIRTVNRATCELLGYTEEELIDKPVGTIFAVPEEASVQIRKLDELTEGGESGSYETEYRTKDGNRIPVILSSSTVKDKDGNVTQLVFIARDITERKRVDEELQKTIAELERSNAELERFAYIASHDLQEPLRMVASYTQLLEKRYKDSLDADAHDFIGYAVDGAKRMQQLINDLLTYSRVGTRGKPLEPTDCMTVFEAAVANLDVAIRESGAEVTSDPLPTFMADEGQLVQLFQNLIDNAIKFHGEEPPHVHVSVEQRGDEWVFSVRDNGIGIDPQYLEQAFMVFQRLHSGKYPGTGIGLSIARRIVERHGGRIWIESQPGKGTIVHFTIPAKGGKQS